MNRTDLLTDELIQAAFEGRSRRAVPRDLRDAILAVTATTRQQSAWRLRLSGALSTPALRPALIGLLVLTALLVVALAVALVGQHARAGLLAYIKDGDVYLANADGSDAVRVVHDDGVAFSVTSWSPDGRWVALAAGEGTYLLDPATLDLRRIGTGRGAVWSSDSRSLAYIASTASGDEIIEIARIDTGVVRELRPKLDTGTSLGESIVWSPDGRWFLATTNASNGRRFVRIDAATGDVADIAPMAHLSEPGAHWSPDSRRFAYARPDPCDRPPCQDMLVVEDADLLHAFAIIAIYNPATLPTGPIWSPDGEWIAFVRETLEGGQEKSGPTLSIVRPDGKDMRSLIHASAQRWSWSDDGTSIVFSNNDASTGSAVGTFEVTISDGIAKTISRSPNSRAIQRIPAGRPIPTLPTLPPVASAPVQSSAPRHTPQAAPPADPKGSWSGLAVDGYCGILRFDTMTPRGHGTVCHDVGGGLTEPDGAVFAPLGSAYALQQPDGSVTIVSRGGAAITALGPIAALPAEEPVQMDLAWSPDGRWLAVHRCVQGANGDCPTPEYVVISEDGRGERRTPGMPSWSPDGRRLVVKAQNGDLLMGSPDGSDLRSIGTFPLPSSWSPDATQFAFIRDGDAWIVNADGTGERTLTSFAHGGASGALWSPDGRFMAVQQETRFSIVTLADGNLQPIDLGTGRDGSYGSVWSPDSARLAVVIGPGEKPGVLIFRTSDWAATFLGGKGIESVAWSPDGRFISLVDTTSTPGTIDIANSDGSGRRTVWLPPGSATKATWVH